MPPLPACMHTHKMKTEARSKTEETKESSHEDGVWSLSGEHREHASGVKASRGSVQSQGGSAHMQEALRHHGSDGLLPRCLHGAEFQQHLLPPFPRLS